jgi:large subunit ribosomal protein L32
VAGQPKKRISRARQGERRSHLGLRAANLTPCPQCRTPKRPHAVCPNCGTYRGRQVVAIKQKKPAAT